MVEAALQASVRQPREVTVKKHVDAEISRLRDRDDRSRRVAAMLYKIVTKYR